MKDVCHTAYVRQEVFEEQFANALNRLHFDQAVLEWMVKALKHSNEDKQQFHNEAIERLKAEHARLDQRINTMYIDKLDGKISTAFFDAKSQEWRREQEKLLETIRSHQNANYVYIDEGIKLLELAQSAHNLFIRQTPAEKRRLLDYIISNSVWDGKSLAVEFKQPFDIIAKSAKIIKLENTQKTAKNSNFDKWLPGPDSNQRPTG